MAEDGALLAWAWLLDAGHMPPALPATYGDTWHCAHLTSLGVVSTQARPWGSGSAAIHSGAQTGQSSSTIFPALLSSF